MKTIVYILTFFLSISSAIAQKRDVQQEVIDLNKRALELYMRNLSNKDSMTMALELLDKAISLDCKSVTTYGNKLNILKFNHKYDEMLNTLDEAIRNNPNEYGLYLMKGAALEKLERMDEAVPVYKKALELCEDRLEQKPLATTFMDCFFLKYCVYGIDTPASEVIAAIPSSFTETERKKVADLMDMIGSFKRLKSSLVYGENLPIESPKSSSMPQKREDGAYFVVDEMAEFPGGTIAMQSFIGEHFKRPANCNQGFALVNFVIDTDGTIRDAKIVRSAGKEADNEALRVVKLMPKWKPAKVKGEVVPMVYNIPFRIQ